MQKQSGNRSKLAGEAGQLHNNELAYAGKPRSKSPGGVQDCSAKADGLRVR